MRVGCSVGKAAALYSIVLVISHFFAVMSQLALVSEMSHIAMPPPEYFRLICDLRTTYSTMHSFFVLKRFLPKFAQSHLSIKMGFLQFISGYSRVDGLTDVFHCQLTVLSFSLCFLVVCFNLIARCSIMPLGCNLLLLMACHRSYNKMFWTWNMILCSLN